MLEINQISKLKEHIDAHKAAGKSIALVPTMGYLHAGHASLISRARKENDVVVVSIFVNPIQFAPNEDLDKYPRNLAADLDYCQNLGVDLVFAPAVEEMYPAGFSSFADVYTLGDNLCGAKRAGHFRGVCTVILKLFNIARP